MQFTMSRRSETRPSRRAVGWLWLIALWSILSGCTGGSGSSGFDVLAENAVIDQALDSDSCETFEGLTICAAAPEPIATETPIAPAATPSETATSVPSVTPSPTHTPIVTDFTATPTIAVTATPTSEVTGAPTSAATVSATPSGTPAAQSTQTRTGTPVFGTPTATTTGAVPIATPTEFHPPGTATVTATAPRSPTARLTQTVRPTRTPIAATPTTTRVPNSPTPSATASPSRPSVETNVSASGAAPNDTVPCRSETVDTCTFVFEFRPIGLPSSASYRVALRTRNPQGEWTVVEAPGNRAEINVQNTSASDQYQFAVLVFLSDPTFVPDSVDLLSDTGADLAFVTPIVTAARF